VSHADHFEIGIAIIAAMIDDPMDSSLAAVVVQQYLDDGVAPEHIIASVCNLASMLLVMNRHVTGIPEQVALQFVAKMINKEDLRGR
jgi:hypothetical protein